VSAPFAGWLPVYAAPAEGDALAMLGCKRLGVGKVAAATSACVLLEQRRPQGVLLFGVCGAFPARHCAGGLRIGNVVLVGSDTFGDEGTQTEHEFLDLQALGLPSSGPFPADAQALAAAARLLAVPQVAGVTVSTCSGNEALSAARAACSGALVETMEGAAVAHVCAQLGRPFVQVRAVANWTGDRARAGWDLAAAVAAVQSAVRQLLQR